MAGRSSPITPSVLAWAVAEDGRPKIALAQALDIDEGLLDEWLEGETLPTVGQVSAIATELRRPRAMFFMPGPPAGATLPATFRRPPGDDRSVSATARRSVRRARRLQTLISTVIADGAQVDVPRYSLTSAPDAAAAAARKWLGMTLPQQAAWSNDYQAMHAWRAALDAKGVFVFALEIGEPARGENEPARRVVSEEVRGFSAWDDKAPLIVMNSRKVSPAARTFTLGHELGHLVTRLDAACIEPMTSAPFSEPVERWCEEFAASLLMPKSAVERFAATVRGLSGPTADLEDVVAVKNAFRVSARAAALRLIDLDLATRPLYATVEAYFRPKPATTKEVNGGTPRWQRRLRQFGPRALETIFSEIPPGEALSLLKMTVPDARELANEVPSAAVL